MSAEHPSVHVQRLLLVLATVLHAFAVVLASCRLWIRLCLRRLWWEDAWVALAVCLAVVGSVSAWMLTLPERARPRYMSQEFQIIMMWLKLISRTCLIWTVRMSIVFSSIRVVHSTSRMRNVGHGFAIVFFFMWALCVASVAYACTSGSHKLWHTTPHLHCRIGMPVAMVEFATSIVANVVLIALPAWVLWQMRTSSRNERVLVLSILSMSLLGAMTSIVHMGFLIPKPGYAASVTADIKGALDLALCNILVFVSSAYRKHGVDTAHMGRNDLVGKSSESFSSETTIATLTTIDLEHFETLSIHTTQSAPVPQSGASTMRQLSQWPSFDGTV